VPPDNEAEKLPDPLKPGSDTSRLKQEGLAEERNFAKQESPKLPEQILHWATKQFFDADGTLLVREIGVLAAVVLCGYAFVQDNGARMLDSVVDINHFVFKCAVISGCVFSILLVYRLLVDLRAWLLVMNWSWVLRVIYIGLILTLGITAARMITAAETKQTIEKPTGTVTAAPPVASGSSSSSKPIHRP